MKMKDIMKVIEELSYSQGSYGRLKREIYWLEDNDPEGYNALVEELEGQNFKDSLDLILYLEG